MAQVLLRYKNDHFSTVLVGFVSLYLFMQSFAIPGCLVLSVLAGALFGVPTGLLIVSCVASCGATGCYLLSRTLAGPLVARTFPDKLATFRGMIQRNRHNLFFYLLFLRATPFMPNWFINLSSPLLEVPIAHFFFATLFGLIPANFFHVTTGNTLREVQSSGVGAVVDWRMLLAMVGMGCLALVPTLFRSSVPTAAETDGAQSDASGGGIGGGSDTSASTAAPVAVAAANSTPVAAKVKKAGTPRSARASAATLPSPRSSKTKKSAAQSPAAATKAKAAASKKAKASPSPSPRAARAAAAQSPAAAASRSKRSA